MVIGRVRTRAVNATLGEDDKLPGRYRQLDAIFFFFLEVESVGRLVEAFLSAEANRADFVVRTAGKPQAATFRSGIINRHPHG
jgi:hypothetical protein